MDKDNRQQPTPKENDPPRPQTDPTEEVQRAAESTSPGQRNEGQTDHPRGGWSWYQFLPVAAGVISAVAAVITFAWRWYADTATQTDTREKVRARIVPDVEWTSESPITLSLVFKNVGETIALNTYGAWLAGECPHSSSGDCALWCLLPLSETEAEGYGSLAPQKEYVREFTYTPKTEKKRKGATKDRPPFYFCGYFAYTDVFCTWRRRFQCLYYESATNKVRFCPIGNDEQETQVQGCRP